MISLKTNNLDIRINSILFKKRNLSTSNFTTFIMNMENEFVFNLNVSKRNKGVLDLFLEDHSYILTTSRLALSDF